MKIEKVSAIGSGIMGHGIALVTAIAGIPVQLNDISDEVVTKAKTNIENALARGPRKGKLAPISRRLFLIASPSNLISTSL